MKSFHGSLLACIITLMSCGTQDKISLGAQPSRTEQKVILESEEVGGQIEESEFISLGMGYFNTSKYRVTADYTPEPRYRGVTVMGKPGTTLDVWVRSTNGHDPVALLIDGKGIVQAINDDAEEGGLDSHLVYTFPGPKTAYDWEIIFREYSMKDDTFELEPKGNGESPTCDPYSSGAHSSARNPDAPLDQACEDDDGVSVRKCRFGACVFSNSYNAAGHAKGVCNATCTDVRPDIKVGEECWPGFVCRGIGRGEQQTPHVCVPVGACQDK